MLYKQHIFHAITRGGDELRFINKNKWLGFHNRMGRSQVLHHAVSVGLISKAEEYRITYNQTDPDLGFRGNIFIKGNWFDHITDIGFRFDLGSDGKLTEIMFIYDSNEKAFFPYSLEEFYQSKLRSLEEKYGDPNKWTNLGISLRGDKRTQIIFFLD